MTQPDPTQAPASDRLSQDRAFCLDIAALFALPGTGLKPPKLRAMRIINRGGWVILDDNDGSGCGEGSTEAGAWADCRRRYEARRIDIVSSAARLKALSERLARVGVDQVDQSQAHLADVLDVTDEEALVASIAMLEFASIVASGRPLVTVKWSSFEPAFMKSVGDIAKRWLAAGKPLAPEGNPPHKLASQRAWGDCLREHQFIVARQAVLAHRALSAFSSAPTRDVSEESSP